MTFTPVVLFDHTVKPNVDSPQAMLGGKALAVNFGNSRGA